MKQSKTSYPLAIAIGLGLSLLIFAGKGGFTQRDSYELYRCVSDAFFFPGILYFCFSLLMFVSGEGVFNIFGFAVNMVALPFLKKNRERDRMSYLEYCRQKQEKKANAPHLGYLCVIGLGFLLISLLFALLCEKGL